MKSNKVGNVLVGLLCLFGLIVLILGMILMVDAVKSAYAKQLTTTGRVEFKQVILPAPETRKATVIDVQPTAVKEVVQNTARP